MASSEIVVTVGADTSELEKGLKDVQKSSTKATSDSSSFVSMLGRAYGVANAIYSAVRPIIDFMIEYAERARALRNLSVASGMPIEKLQQYEAVAKNAGISLQTFGHSMAEFNKKMGEAKIRGTEANAALAKLGFGLKDINNGSLKYEDALYAMADAFQAGTDDATLMHYGVQLFGSSFEQLLPIIKQGSGEIKKQMESAYTAETEYAEAAARNAAMWDRTKQMFESIFIDIVGMFQEFGESMLDTINNKAASAALAWKSIWGFGDKGAVEDYATEIYRQRSAGHSKKENEEYYKDWMERNYLSEEDQKIFMDKIKELEGGKGGKKLSPLGLGEAQGASSMQQMGGGDIVSAMAFSPIERIADATEQTAKNTDPDNQLIQETTNTTNKFTVGIGY